MRFKRTNALLDIMGEDVRLEPVSTTNIKLRGIPPELRDRLVVIKDQQTWRSWADMLLWVHANRHSFEPVDAVQHEPKTGYIVCRDIPLEIKYDLVRTKRRLEWKRWSDLVYLVLREFEGEEK